MTMDSRNDFLLQLLQKLGAPLAAAVQTGAKDDTVAAQTMASLLSASVKIGIGLSQSMNLKPSDGDADAIRVSLTALAARMTADFYAGTGRAPGDADTARMQKLLESLMAFADNFAPAAEHAQRLKTLEGPPPFFDPMQADLYAIHACLPAISAISEFSFGQEHSALIQDVAQRLGAKAKGMNGVHDLMGEMVALSALAQIYASAHRAETARLSTAGDGEQPSIETVWASFEKQVAMLDVLIGSLSGQGSSSGRGGSGGVKPAVEVQQAEESPPAPPPQAVAPASAPPPAAPPSGQSGNPMSFFKKK